LHLQIFVRNEDQRAVGFNVEQHFSQEKIGFDVFRKKSEAEMTGNDLCLLLWGCVIGRNLKI
jgi:hypothetical protein